MPLNPTITGAAGSGDAPTPIVGVIVGADPAVESLTFDVQTYATAQGLGTIPAITGTTIDPQAGPHNAVGDGAANDTAAIQSAITAMSPGDALDLSGGLYAVAKSSDDIFFITDDNVTFFGGGFGTGFTVHSSHGGGSSNRFDALLRIQADNVVIRDMEIDGADRAIGAVTHEGDNLWVYNCYFHAIGDGTANSPNAVIKGATGHTGDRIIACRLEDTSVAGVSGVRGYWSTDNGTNNVHVANCIVRDTGHSGIIIHQDNDPANTSIARLNSVFNAAVACFKPELSNTVSVTAQPTGNLSTYERNYVKQETGPWAFQPETIACRMTQNWIIGRQRNMASFDQNGMRQTVVEDNVFQEADEYYMHMDPVSRDATDHLIQFNTMENPTKSNVPIGINFHNGYNNSAAFTFDKPITVKDNKISDASVNVGTQPLLTSYSNFTNIGNGPSGAGARDALVLNTGQPPPGPGPGWVPTDHATLLEWWNAGLNVATTGSDVDTWTGQEAGLIGTPPATKPIFVSSSINGKPGIDFNTASRLIVPAATAINNVWAKGTLVYMWCVVKITGVAAFSRILDKGFDGDGNGWRIRHDEVGHWEFSVRGSNDLIIETTNTFGLGDYALELSWDEGAGQPTLRVNGTVESWSTGDTGATFNDDSATGFTIGGQTVSATGQMDGHVLDLWFAQDPAAELTDARAYITSEYGLSA